MRCLVFLLTALLAVYLSCGTPINPKRILINRPTEHYGQRSRRSPPIEVGGVNGQDLSELELTLTKGEYICGDKICKLQPGEIPEDCPYCQHSIA